MSDDLITEQPTDELPDVGSLSDEQLMARYREPAAAPAAAPETAPSSVAAAAAVTQEAGAPVVPAAPEPVAAEPAATNEPVAEPQPAIDPATQRNPEKANNYRLQAQNAVEQQALELRAQDRTLSLQEALVQAHEMLGLPPPFATAAPKASAPATPETAPDAEEADPLAEIEAEIATLNEQKKALNKVIDADEVDALNERISALREERSQERARQFYQEQQEMQRDEQVITDLERQVQAEFPDLANAQHPMAIAYEKELREICANAPDSVLLDPEMELKLAERIATRFQNEFQMPVRRASKPVAQAPAPAPTVTQPAPAQVAAAPAAAVRPSSAAAPVVGASASASPVMGIAPQNPKDEFEALLASDKPLDGDADALLLRTRFGTAPAPANGRFQRVA